jgi:hypothetical protein
MDKTQIDIKENYLYRLDHELLAILLKDRSSGKTLSGQRITTETCLSADACSHMSARPENGPKRSLIIGTVWG